MKIKGRLGEYKVMWRTWGWTYVTVSVFKERKFWFDKKLWESAGPNGSVDYMTAERMYPKEMRAWFESVVKEYEDYIEAWREYNE